MKAVVFFLWLTGLGIQSSFGSGGGSHGGDTQLIEKAEIQLFIKNELKNRIKDTLTWIISQPQSKNYDSFKSQVKKWVDDRMMDDIDSSTFAFSDVCYATITGEKIIKEASTPAEKSAPICWALDLLGKSKPKKSALVALGFHEFVHHFNVADRDHILAAQFKALYLESMKVTGKKKYSQTGNQKPILMDVSYICEINHPETTQKLTKFELYSDENMIEKTVKTFVYSTESGQSTACFKLQAELEKKEAQRKMNTDFEVGERQLSFLEYACRNVKWLSSGADSNQVLFKMVHYTFNGETSNNSKYFGPYTTELGAYPNCDSKRKKLAQTEELRLKALGKSAPHIVDIEEKWTLAKKKRQEQEEEKLVADVSYKCRYSSKTEEQLYAITTYGDQSTQTTALGIFPNDQFDTFLKQSCEERRSELEIIEAKRKKNEQKQNMNQIQVRQVFHCVYASKTEESLIKTVFFRDGSSNQTELGTYPNDDFDTFLQCSCSEKRKQAEKIVSTTN